MAYPETFPCPPEQTLVLKDAHACLDGIIAIHSTKLGPAAGGCRLWSYPSVETAAADALRLAESMAYKNAIAGLPLGGGKAVLRRPEGDFDRRRLFEAFGRAVEEARGAYVTAEDVGTSVDDMTVVASATHHVAGLAPRGGAPGGDPSPWTARGVFLPMTLLAERRLDRPLRDCIVAIQGVGHVGGHLARMLATAGAKLLVANVNHENVERIVRETGATPLHPGAVISANADIVSPCALGGVLSHATVNSIHTRVVCGAANTQLANPTDGERLADREVLYVPDYVVNAGGIINVAAEYLNWTLDGVERRVAEIPVRLAQILDLAASQGGSSNESADGLGRTLIGDGAASLRAAV